MTNPTHHSEELRSLVRMRKRGMYIYALPNFFTSMNLILGFLAILAAVDGRFERSAWAILLATIFDMLDGRVARLTNTTSKFGVEFDSLCDLVSFGVAPSLLIFYSSLKPFGRMGIVAAILFALCGALRLARFNVMADVLPKSYFQGLPIPMASILICTSYFFANEIHLPLVANPAFLFLTMSTALLMVSSFKFPSFKEVHLRHRKPFTLIGLGICVFIVVVSWFEIAAFLLFATYVVVSIVLDLYRSSKALRKPAQK